MENPLDAFEFPAAPPQQQPRKSPFNQSDSDYMSVSDSLATASRSNEASTNSNEPIYHTLDEDQPVPRGAVGYPLGKDPDDLVYINSALEVVYPTQTMLRKQQKLLEQMGRAARPEEEEDDREFEELLGGRKQEDMYENHEDVGRIL